MSKILLIEDDEDLRSMLARILRKRGHEVEEAANGRAGLAAMAKSPAALVITDLVMPEKEGVETIRSLRANFPAVKVIAISGLSRRTDFYLKLATKFGADLTLAKPFSLQNFEQAVSQMLVGDSKPN